MQNVISANLSVCRRHGFIYSPKTTKIQIKSIKTITILLQSNIILIMINYHLQFISTHSSCSCCILCNYFSQTILYTQLCHRADYIRWFSCSSQFIQIYHAGYSSCNLTNAPYTTQCNLQYCYWSFYSEVSECYVFPNIRAAS